MGNKNSKIIESIKEVLCDNPLPISHIAKKINADWRTVEQYLKVLEKLDLVKEDNTGHSRVYYYKDKNNYFDLPVKKKHSKIISTIYFFIKESCLKKHKKEPTKTQALKILWKVNKKFNLNLPIGWYRFGPCCPQAYQGNELEDYTFQKQQLAFVKETTEDYCSYESLKLQRIVYNEAKKELYQTKDALINEEFKTKEELNSILMDLIKNSPRETIDVVTDFARTVLLKGWKDSKHLFGNVWKYVTMIIFKGDLKDYYSGKLSIYFDKNIKQIKKEAEIDINNFVKSIVSSKHSQDKRFQSWKKTQK